MPGEAAKLPSPIVQAHAFFALLLILSTFPCLAQSPGDLKWVAPIANGQVHSSPSIAADGTIYVGHSGSWPGLYAINPDGTEKWYFKPGDAVWTAPAIGADGTVYFGIEDYDKFFAVNPDGTEKWVLELFGECYGSPAIGQDGTLYVGLDQYQNDSFYAINPNGTVKWSLDTGGVIYSAPAIAPDGTIYVSQEELVLLALRPDGSLKWSSDLPGGTGYYSALQSSPAIGIDGAIYIGGGNGNLYAVNPDDGSIRWAYDTGAKITASPAIGTDGTIYVGSWNGILSAVNPDGTSKWDFATGNDIDSSAAIGADGTIYFASWGGRLWAVNPDGTEKWQGSIGGEPFSSPMIGSDGTVYIGGNSNLYAFYSDSLGLAQSTWPAYRQDVERTGRAETVVTPLTLGASIQTALTEGQAQYYSLQTSANDSVLVQVQSVSGIDSLFLSAQFEGTTYQTGEATPQGTWELNFAPTISGQYLLVVYGTQVDATGGEYVILADSVARHVSDLDPRIAGNGGLASLLISGLGFEEGMTAELTDGGPVLTASTVTTSSVTEILARFDLTGASLGTYDLRVVWPDLSSQTLTDAFEITAGMGAQLEARLVAPEFVRAQRRYIAWLEYENTGDADMLAPLFTVESNAEISSDPENLEGHRVEVLGVGGSADPHVLRVGEQGRIPIYFLNRSADAADFTLSKVIDDDTVVIWEDQKDVMKPPGMDASEWDALWPALVARLGTTWSDYIGVLRSEAQRVAERGLPAYEVSRLLDIEIGLAGGQPVSAISGVLRHGDTIEPLPGVLLRARAVDGTVLVEAKTGFHLPGQYVFSGLPDGSYEIYVEGYYFDPPATVDVLGVDVNGLELLAYEFPPQPEIPEQEIPQHTPAAVVDGAGTLYLVWQQGEEIWWAIDPGTGWSHSGAIPNATGTRPIMVYDAMLLDGGSTPGLFVAWEAGGPVSTIEWSVGRFTTEGIDWAEPQSMTADTFDDFGLAVVTDIQNEPVVLWLQKDYSLEDDTDLYFQIVDSTTLLASDSRSGFDDSSTAVSPLDFCPPTITKLAALPKSIPIVGGKWGFSSIAEGCELLSQCNPNPTPLVKMEIPLGQLAKFLGSAGMSFKFQTDPCDCKYVLGEAALNASIGIGVSQPVYKMPLILGDVPVGMAGLNLDLNGTLSGDLVWVTNFPDLGASQGRLDLVTGYAIVGKVTFVFGLEGTVTGSAEVKWSNRQPDYDIKFEGECVKLEGIADMGFGTVQESYCIDWGSTCNPRCSVTPLTVGSSDSDGLLLEAIEEIAQGAEGESTWSLEYLKHALIGTGATYEGNPVLGDISSDLFTDGLPSVAKSGSGQVLLVWAKAEAAENLGAKVWATDWGVGSWNSPTAITPEVNFNKDPVVVFDSTGTAMVVWSQASNAGLDFDLGPVEDIVVATELADLYFSQRAGASWSAPLPLAVLSGRDEQPSLAAGPSGEITIAWLNQTDSGWTLHASNWNGSVWSTPLALATPALAYRPVVYYQGSTPTILWTQDNDGDMNSVGDWTLFLSDWNGAAWSAPAPAAIPISPNDNQVLRASTGTQGIDFPDPPPSCCTSTCDSSGSSGPSSPDSQQNDLDHARSNNVGGIDPNEKVGPLGVGIEQYVQAGDVLDYVVYFENLPAASAPAQEVFVYDCLSQELDWASLRLKEVAFGDVLVPNLTDAALFTDRVTIPDYRPAEDLDWWVDIEPVFDLVTGCLVVTFRTLDPETGELPADPFAGFLPPEDGTGRGQGYVSFAIHAKSDLPDGTLISNQASIVFDTNDPIATNRTTNTIGQPAESYLLSVSVTGPGSVVSDPAGIDCGSDCSELYPSGTRLDLFGVPDTGMMVYEWGGHADCRDGRVTTDADKTCTADFRPIDIFGDDFESGDTSAWSSTQ